MRFIPLASSSHGNAYLLEDGETRLLIECGVTYKKLQKLTDFDISGIAACLISHEHKDHAGCYDQLLKNGIPVYASEGTAQELDCELIEVLEDRKQVTIGTFDILPFPTFHDAAEPMGFLIRSQADGEKLVFATDTVNLGYQFPGVSILAVECNYSSYILHRCTRMPEKVRHRIENSHMEVSRLCSWLETLSLDSCREIYLLHLSDACANEDEFLYQVRCSVPKHISVITCPKVQTIR